MARLKTRRFDEGYVGRPKAHAMAHRADLAHTAFAGPAVRIVSPHHTGNNTQQAAWFCEYSTGGLIWIIVCIWVNTRCAHTHALPTSPVELPSGQVRISVRAAPVLTWQTTSTVATTPTRDRTQTAATAQQRLRGLQYRQERLRGLAQTTPLLAIMASAQWLGPTPRRYDVKQLEHVVFICMYLYSCIVTCIHINTDIRLKASSPTHTFTRKNKNGRSAKAGVCMRQNKHGSCVADHTCIQIDIAWTPLQVLLTHTRQNKNGRSEKSGVWMRSKKIRLDAAILCTQSIKLLLLI